MVDATIVIIILAIIAISVFVGALIKSRKYRVITEPQIVTEEKVVKKRNKKLNTCLMVIYVVLMLVIIVPDHLNFLMTVTFIEWGREWAKMNPQLNWDMTLGASGAITMGLFIALLSWRFMMWLHYDVMGGRSLLDRLMERGGDS